MRKIRLGKRRGRLRKSKNRELSRDMRWNCWVYLLEIFLMGPNSRMLPFSLPLLLELSITDWAILNKRRKKVATSADLQKKIRKMLHQNLKPLDFYININTNSLRMIGISAFPKLIFGWTLSHFLWKPHKLIKNDITIDYIKCNNIKIAYEIIQLHTKQIKKTINSLKDL